MENDSIKVIGVGYGRTGTASLKAALDMLGFGPTYHMFEVSQNSETHTPLWKEAFDSFGTGTFDWSKFFSQDKYRSTVDWPGAYFWEELHEKNPHAKLILTVRDDADAWYESVNSTIYTRSQQRAHRGDLGKVSDLIVWNGLFEGKFSDKEFATQLYTNHIEKFQKRFTDDALLVYNVKQGWKPLCDFLGVDTPNENIKFPEGQYQGLAYIIWSFRTNSLAPCFTSGNFVFINLELKSRA